MNRYTVTIGADLRCYASGDYTAASKEEAKADALKQLRDHGDLVADMWKWKPEELQGDISIMVLDADDRDDDPEFEPVEWDTPRYRDLEEFARQMARLTLPEEEFESLKAEGGGKVAIDGQEYADASEYESDFSDDRLLDEFTAFKAMIRKAREITTPTEKTDDDNPFHPESPEGRAWEAGDRSSVE